MVVPAPSVTVMADYTAPHYGGTPLTLTCVAILTHVANTNVTVTFAWSKNQSPLLVNSRINETITEVSGCENCFKSSLYFYPLDHMGDSGNYTCAVSVELAIIDSLYTTDPTVVVQSTAITVLCE